MTTTASTISFETLYKETLDNLQASLMENYDTNDLSPEQIEESEVSAEQTVELVDAAMSKPFHDLVKVVKEQQVKLAALVLEKGTPIAVDAKKLDPISVEQLAKLHAGRNTKINNYNAYVMAYNELYHKSPPAGEWAQQDQKAWKKLVDDYVKLRDAGQLPSSPAPVVAGLVTTVLPEDVCAMTPEMERDFIEKHIKEGKAKNGYHLWISAWTKTNKTGGFPAGGKWVGLPKSVKDYYNNLYTTIAARRAVVA